MKIIEIIEDEKEFDEHYDKIINALENNDINITTEVSTKDVLNLINHIETECLSAEIQLTAFKVIIDKINSENKPKGVNVGYYNDDKFNQELDDFLSFRGK